MTDVFSAEKRSEVMSRIRSRGNKDTELRLIEIFRKSEITGWRRNQNLFGKPDFVFRSTRVVVFVDGCFWHGCPRCYRRPASNRKYWDAKVDRNRQRDREVTRSLTNLGWHVVRIWEHELSRRNEARCLRRVRRVLLEFGVSLHNETLGSGIRDQGFADGDRSFARQRTNNR
ncbi:MAG: very short patch repair endonuclease [Planctomycetales bacterium]|nr:very short patch repair endonuclease [Planctomycetales bacterium]